jgi:hypothetical protein
LRFIFLEAIVRMKRLLTILANRGGRRFHILSSLPRRNATAR